MGLVLSYVYVDICNTYTSQEINGTPPERFGYILLRHSPASPSHSSLLVLGEAAMPFSFQFFSSYFMVLVAFGDGTEEIILAFFALLGCVASVFCLHKSNGNSVNRGKRQMLTNVFPIRLQLSEKPHCKLPQFLYYGLILGMRTLEFLIDVRACLPTA